MRIVHTADLHLGVSTYGPLNSDTGISQRISDHFDTLDSIIDFSIDENADLFIIAGDIFHMNDPNPTLLGMFSERVVRVGKQCPVVIIPGNHDLPRSLDRASAVDIYDVLDIDNVIIGYDYEVHGINTRVGEVQVVTFPFPHRNWFVDRNKSDEEYRDALRILLEDLRTEVKENCPAIFVGHFSIDGAKVGSEGTFTFSGEAELCLGDLRGPWQYVAMGHIHLYQEMMIGNIPVVYPGSPDIIDFGEENDDKGFVLVDIVDGMAVTERVGVDTRPFKTVTFHFNSSDIGITGKITRHLEKMNLEDCVIRIVVTVPEGKARIIDVATITKFLKVQKKIYYLYSFNVREESSGERMRLDVPVSSMSDFELLKLYFSDMKRSELSSLMKIARDIMED